MVGTEGFEPSSSGIRVQRVSQLHYIPKNEHGLLRIQTAG